MILFSSAKRLITVLFLLGITATTAKAQLVTQQINKNFTGDSVNSNLGRFQVSSSNPAAPTSTDGILAPRVDTFSATNPNARARGLMVYLQKDITSPASSKGYYFWDGAVWQPLISGSNNSPWIRRGSNTVLVDSSNFVGIGTTNPANQLHVVTQGSNPLRLTMKGTIPGGIVFIDSTSPQYPSFRLQIDHRSNINNYADGTGLNFVSQNPNTGNFFWPMLMSANKLTDDSKVEFNKYTPPGGSSYVAINGQTASASGNSALKVTQDSTGAVLNVNRKGSPLLVIPENNNVGIGTATPTAKLEVAGTGLFSPATPGSAANVRIAGSGSFPAALAFKDIDSIPQFYYTIDKRNIFGTGSNYNLNLTYQDPKVADVFGWLTMAGVENNAGTYRTNQVIGDPYVSRIHKIQFYAATGGTGDYPAYSFRELSPASTQDIFRLTKQGYNNIFKVDATGNCLIGFNGTGIPTSKLEVVGKIKATDINFTGLQTYATDAAAGAGGLVVGDMYKTATGELRIKL